MGSRVLLGVPLVLASSGCAFSTRAGPEVMALPAGPALEARGTATFGLGSASGQSAVQVGIPVSLSGGSRLDDGEAEGTFESGFEYTRVGERFGFRSSLRAGTQLGQTTGGYVGLRGGPVLMLKQAQEGHSTPAVTLEGFIGAGTGGNLGGEALFGACLSIDMDYYSRFDLPHGRPFRCGDGSVWRGQARLGRRRSASLGEVKEQVEKDGGISCLQMLDLRDAVGQSRLGQHVRNRISNEMAGVGPAHEPVELPEYQNDVVLVFKRGTKAERIVEAVRTPSTAGAKIIRERASGDAQAKLDQIREILEDV